MKYISLILFTAALVWTWNLIHSQPDISFETHSGIQEKLATLITDTIKAKKPSATDIVVRKIWTEVISASKVKAFFVYSFKDQTDSGSVNSEIKGEGLLERKGEDEAGNDHWVLTKVQTSSDAIQFDEATIVTGSASGSSDSTEATSPTSEPSPEKTQPAPIPTEEHH